MCAYECLLRVITTTTHMSGSHIMWVFTCNRCMLLCFYAVAVPATAEMSHFSCVHPNVSLNTCECDFISL